MSCYFFLKSRTGIDLTSKGMLAGPKVYFVQTHNENIKQVCKEVPLHYVKENFNMSFYRNCVENNLVPSLSLMAIRSLKLRNCTIRVDKNAMLAISDKVYVRDNVRVLTTRSLPYFISRRIYRTDGVWVWRKLNSWLEGGPISLQLSNVFSSHFCIVFISSVFLVVFMCFYKFFIYLYFIIFGVKRRKCLMLYYEFAIIALPKQHLPATVLAAACCSRVRPSGWLFIRVYIEQIEFRLGQLHFDIGGIYINLKSHSDHFFADHQCLAKQHLTKMLQNRDKMFLENLKNI